MKKNSMEELGARAKIFSLDGLGQQKDSILANDLIRAISGQLFDYLLFIGYALYFYSMNVKEKSA